jgi:phosphate transport system substrate-binding protein
MLKLSKSRGALLVIGLLVVPVYLIAETIVTGSGGSFPAPVYAMWLKTYQQAHPDAKLEYQPIGSGGGIRLIMEGRSDFGGSDAPMTDKQMQDYKAKHGYDILHFPTVIGAAVPVYNIPGSPELNFTPEALAGIYLGTITKWNDPSIRDANPKANLPGNNIIVVHRSDGSGTSYIWADYLGKVSDAWRTKYGKGTSINWPVGIGARGNEGVADLVQRTQFTLGYVELSYALQKHMVFGLVRNAAGNFIKADLASVTAAAADTSQGIPEDFRMSVTNAGGKDAYPISSFSWLLIPAKIEDAGKKKAVVDFLTWALKDGQKLTQDLVYARVPDRVVSKELAAISKIQ